MLGPLNLDELATQNRLSLASPRGFRSPSTIAKISRNSLVVITPVRGNLIVKVVIDGQVLGARVRNEDPVTTAVLLAVCGGCGQPAIFKTPENPVHLLPEIAVLLGISDVDRGDVLVQLGVHID